MPQIKPLLPLALAALLVALLPACDSDPGYEHIYTVRGQIIALPGEKATQEFFVHHEEIPDYVSINGSIGMNEMIMPFPLPDRSVLDGLVVGDKIEIVYGERFEPWDQAKAGVISITKLPADTELNLSHTSSNP